MSEPDNCKDNKLLEVDLSSNTSISYSVSLIDLLFMKQSPGNW